MTGDQEVSSGGRPRKEGPARTRPWQGGDQQRGLGAGGAPPRPPGEGPHCRLAGRPTRPDEAVSALGVAGPGEPGSWRGELRGSCELGRGTPASSVLGLVPGGQGAQRREAAEPGKSGLSPECAPKPAVRVAGPPRAAQRAVSPTRGSGNLTHSHRIPGLQLLEGGGCCETRLEGTVGAGRGEMGSS